MSEQQEKTKICKYCQSEIPVKAKICPNCRKKQKGKGRLILLIIVVLIVIIAILSNNNSDDKKQLSSNTPTNTSQEANNTINTQETEIEYLKVTATELIEAFRANQVKCAKTYDGKWLEVTGTVESIGTDILNDVYLTLKNDTEWTWESVQCYAKDAEEENNFAEVSEGDVITLRGVADCDDSLGFYLKKAEIVK